MKAFKNYNHLCFVDSNGNLLNGKFTINGCIMNFEKGFLNDSQESAIKTIDGTHLEHWKNGVLHCDYGPAVIDTNDCYEEWWQNGIAIN